MQAFNKIGFHGGGAEPAPGLRSWMTQLDENGIPFFFAAPDVTSGLLEAQEIARATAVPHTVVYRSCEGPPAPAVAGEPAAAAAAHWAAHRATFPAALDPDVTWIVPVHNVTAAAADANWHGAFAAHLAELALADGFKLAALGFGVGQPERAVWEAPDVVAYLQLCAEHPERLAVALHEFSLRFNDIGFMWGEKIGRVQHLFRACDELHLERPPVLIPTWGWTEARLPGRSGEALEHVARAAELYARFPQIRGAALWTLDARNPISRQARNLLERVTTFTLAQRFELPDAAPAEPERAPMSPAALLLRTAVAPQPNARFLADLTIPDDTRIVAGQRFTKKWLVENNGRVAWDDNFRFVHSAGAPMTAQTVRPLPPTAPGEQAVIEIEMEAPQTPGVHFSDWRFQDGAGNFFGDIIWTRIIVTAAPQPRVSDSKFVADVTIPDDSAVPAGATFTKTWRVRNTGETMWGPGFTLNFVGGTAMTGALSKPLPAAAPGQEVDISLDLTAPAAPGTYYGDWRMKDAQGNVFGQVVYVRIIVPAPATASLAAPLSQRDPTWANHRLGMAGSPKTIGEWGCLLVCFAMTANALGEETNPSQLNEAMIRRGGFLNLYLTKWNALGDVYNGIVYGGKVAGQPDITAHIDASLAEGRPISVQVDFTRDTPYTDNDQHWVLIVGKDGDDYRINDPWLYPPQEASLRERYGRTGRPLHEAILSAIFYRSTRPLPTRAEPEPAAVRVLQTGMNINPDAPHSNPMDSDVFKGLNWVRWVFKLDARVNEAERGNLEAAFRQYDALIRAYHDMGVKSLIIINQETVWHPAPWTGNDDWAGFRRRIADVAGQIAARYRRYGDQVAYQIWNEGDKRNNPASVFLEPETFAPLLQETAAAIGAAAPEAPIVFNGMATGPEAACDYLRRVRDALGGQLPVDAIGIHPYTRWATKAPFDWGQHFGTLADAFQVYKTHFPNKKLWITEIGVADDNEIGSQYDAEIAAYLLDVYKHVGERHAAQVPVLIWFAWSDWMRNAGIVDKNGNRKEAVYAAFRQVRNRELWA